MENTRSFEKRWLGYFDLLGAHDLVESGNYPKILSIYKKAVEEAKKNCSRTSTIHHVCFSDTFLFYSPTDSGEDFSFVDHVTRWFMYFLVTARIPVRGALSCGDFYADTSESIYFGPALLEAYKYGEAQDWIGFILCPSSVVQLDKLSLPARERLNYAYGSVPYNRKKSRDLESELPVCILGQWLQVNGKNLCLKALMQMKNRITNERHVKKYRNAIQFIEEKGRIIAPRTNAEKPENS